MFPSPCTRAQRQTESVSTGLFRQAEALFDIDPAERDLRTIEAKQSYQGVSVAYPQSRSSAGATKNASLSVPQAGGWGKLSQ
jgi:hypothetical protein